MKEKIFTLRFNQEQFAGLFIEAKNTNMSLGELIRYKLGGERKSDIKRIIFLLNKSSNNINQIAKGINIANLANKINEFTYNQTLARLSIVQVDFNNIYMLIKELKNVN